MKTKFIVGILLLSAVIVINSCENKQGAAPVMAAVCNDTNKLTYSSDSNSMQAIINVQCGTSNTSCHSTNSYSGYDYTTYAGIYANYQSGLLYQALFGNGSQVPVMPLTPQAGWTTDPCLLAKFKAWIDQGCPQ
ncbi:MAG TPA: hypothetical protein VK808_06485 [Bacteroidia bacterium]|nr:hypothetical protein [Bacteroidia bacterium]